METKGLIFTCIYDRGGIDVLGDARDDHSQEEYTAHSYDHCGAGHRGTLIPEAEPAGAARASDQPARLNPPV